MKWVAGSDHAGLDMKNALVAKLRELGDEVEDVGTHDATSVDYPQFGSEVGKRVAADAALRGLVVCGSGIGISIAANKVHGIRCALVHDHLTAQLARQHNDANVIALGARTTGADVATDALLAFRATEFAAGRHQKRVGMLDAM
ncbi:MAG TPA: ribose 5-phosphate isomerase B [Kofleriaceae bacterium]